MSEMEMQAMMGLALGMSGVSPSEIADTIQRTGTRDTAGKNFVVLPAKVTPAHDHECWSALGIVWGEKSGVMRRAQLPVGWQVKRTDHGMWFRLEDERGRERMHFFHKAAFWDCDAFGTLNTRFYTNIDTHSSPCIGKVLDRSADDAPTFQCEVPLRAEPHYPRDREPTEAERVDWLQWYDQEVPEARAAIVEKVDAWLINNWPNHKDPTAYWS